MLMGNAEMPDPVRRMLDAAYASGNEGEVATLVKYARVAAPESADAIAREADGWRTKRREAQELALAEASIVELWKGRAELGGFISSGNSDVTGVAAIIDVTREGPRWRNKIRLQADYQESNGLVSRERYLAAYEPNYKVGDRTYLYGAAQVESDRFLGYDARFSASAGGGIGAVRSSALTLDLELGPAFRQTDFAERRTDGTLAARGRFDLDWKLTPAVTLSQDASAYLQRVNSTVASTTALNARLFGPLSAQLSYAVQYESTPTDGRRTTDTTSRASLVYSF
jgi:putative salt-induced outer membrane protein